MLIKFNNINYIFLKLIGPSGIKMKRKRVAEITYNEESETSDNDDGGNKH